MRSSRSKVRKNMDYIKHIYRIQSGRPQKRSRTPARANSRTPNRRKTNSQRRKTPQGTRTVGRNRSQSRSRRKLLEEQETVSKKLEFSSPKPYQSLRSPLKMSTPFKRVPRKISPVRSTPTKKRTSHGSRKTPEAFRQLEHQEVEPH